jgi:uncharacterized protein involved in outer membrane biogenesis
MDETGSQQTRRSGRLRHWVLLPFLLLALYSVAGFWLAPWLIRSEAVDWVHDKLHKQLSLGEIRVNPFRFTIDITDAAVNDAGKPMVAARRVHLDFALPSLLAHSYRLDALRLDRPFVNAVIRPNGKLNLSELIPQGKSEGPNPSVRIATLTIVGGTADFADLSLPLRPKKRLEPISFTLDDFQTDVAEGGRFTLHARSERDERFAWTGKLSIAPISSKGRLQVTGLKSDTVERFFSERLPLVLDGGSTSFAADYRFAYMRGTTRLDLTVPSLTLAGFRVTGEPGLFHGSATFANARSSLTSFHLVDDDAGKLTLTGAFGDSEIDGLAVVPSRAAPGETISLKSLGIDRAQFDYDRRAADFGKLTLSSLRLPIRREANGRISLMALLASASSPAGVTPQPWTIGMASLALEDAAIDVVDRTVSPAAHFTLQPLRLAVQGSASDFDKPMGLRFETKINGTTRLSGEGSVTAASRSADLSVDLAGLPLRLILPYAPAYPQLDLRSGTAGGRGKLQFANGDPATLRFRGAVSIDDLLVHETGVDAPLVAWKGFTGLGVDYRANWLNIDRGRLTGPVGQVEILRDGSFNYAPLTGGSAPATGSLVAKPPSNRPPAFVLSIRQLEIADGSLGFADHSIDPNFEARIDALQGKLGNVSNLPETVSTVDLSGQVIDRFSPATISGSMNLFQYDRQTDMRVSFRNIELPIFNPYSGRYAGYAIAKGKLSTEFEYKIDQRALNAKHHVVIDQLQWGQATESKQKVPLPIRLASSLLKDKNGVIDLDVPVTGSLDDPHFRLGPIIWKIIGNVIEKAVTAPFRLIGSIFAGAEKAQYVDFAPGSAELPAGSSEALGALGKALVDRTELRLDIPAGPGDKQDAEAIADSRIDALLMAKEARKGKPTDIAALKLDERYDRLKQLYRDKLGRKADLTEAEAAAPASSDAAATMKESERRKLAACDWMRAQLRTALLPGNAELAKLGNARAVAVRDALLAGGTIDPKRLFMAIQISATPSEGHSRLELKLE